MDIEEDSVDDSFEDPDYIEEKKNKSDTDSDYNANRKGDLRTHTESVHKGKKYSCDYFATQKGSLRTHTQYVHEGKKYPCEACDYFATTK